MLDGVRDRALSVVELGVGLALENLYTDRQTDRETNIVIYCHHWPCGPGVRISDLHKCHNILTNERPGFGRNTYILTYVHCDLLSPLGPGSGSEKISRNHNCIKQNNNEDIFLLLLLLLLLRHTSLIVVIHFLTHKEHPDFDGPKSKIA